jgi:muramoyltetrapeptide carboxypeptidase
VSRDAVAGASELLATKPRKGKALHAGSKISIFAPASPANVSPTNAGVKELQRMGFLVDRADDKSFEGYFAGSAAERRKELVERLANDEVDGLVALRGGYGSNYLLDDRLAGDLVAPKTLIGFSDITSLQIFLWQYLGWVSFYGPMIAAGFDAGAGVAGGYDAASFWSAVGNTDGLWRLPLHSDVLKPGKAEGRILGGAMTLVEATIGTPWELDTRGAILLLEDRAMKPYQVDRVLMHLKQAGKFDGVCGIVLGDFPECAPPVAGSPTVRDVCTRILGHLGVPIIFGAPFGHTTRPTLTVPLGVRAVLHAAGEGSLEMLEPAVVA